MPIYDYDCTSCDNIFEIQKGWNDDLNASCPKCGSPSKKRFALPTVLYKGSGFYTTDNRSSSYRSGSSYDSGSSSKPSSSDSKPSDNGSTSAKTESKSQNKSTSKNSSN